MAPRAVETSLALFFVIYSVLLLAFSWYAGCVVLRGPTIAEPAEQPHVARPGKDAAPGAHPAK